eukprot:s2023_g5.t1
MYTLAGRAALTASTSWLSSLRLLKRIWSMDDGAVELLKFLRVGAAAAQVLQCWASSTPWARSCGEAPCLACPFLFLGAVCGELAAYHSSIADPPVDLQESNVLTKDRHGFAASSLKPRLASAARDHEEQPGEQGCFR